MKRADITLPIQRGDDILTGHWKNHREKVKDIGTDKNGQPTINNHPLLNVRIPSLMPQSKTAAGPIGNIQDGWIDDLGEFHPTKYGQHAEWVASKWFVTQDIKDSMDLEENDYTDYEDKLYPLAFAEGYVRVSGDSITFSNKVNKAAFDKAMSIAKDTLFSKDQPYQIFLAPDELYHVKNKVDFGRAYRAISEKLGFTIVSTVTASTVTVAPTVFLGGECSPDNDWRSTVTSHFKGQSIQFIDPYDPEWVAEINIYTELSDAATSDLIIFYKGGEGTQKEMDFFDTLELPYESYDDLPTLLTSIETFLSDWTNKSITTLNKGEVIKVEGIPVQLEEAVEVSTTESNQNLIEDLKAEPNKAQASIRTITAALHEHGCILIPVPQYIRSYLLTEFLADHLNTEDLVEDLLESVEVDSHITCLFGTKVGNEDADCDIVRKLFDKPIHIKTSAVQYFDNEDVTVAYVAVDSPELEVLHYSLSDAIENVDSHPDYVPHICLAYLKQGARLKDGTPKSFEWAASVAVISQPDGHMVSVLDGTTDPAEAVQHIIDTMVGV